ncbi:TetR/AcrR family transcriptional regulator [Paenarthrobacter sp. NPDC090517]|uniref:TetR/AcrR family transcriptional regulator n=1 Tax=Paenarthrobacter sp. NPDC090517 TaxID=3364381 RepID=UPI003824E7CD
MNTTAGRPRQFDRDSALEKAMLLFWERGYDAVSVRDLTAVMGIASPSLYGAFTGKETLFLEAVEVYASQYGSYIQEAIDDEPTAYRVVERFLLQSAIQSTLMGRPAGCLILNGATNYTPGSEGVAERLRQRRADTVARIEQVIAIDVAKGELPEETDSGSLAAFTATVWQGLAQLARDGRPRRDLESAVSMAMQAWPKKP